MSARAGSRRVHDGSAPHGRVYRKRARTWADHVEWLSLRNGVETDAHRLSQRQKQIDYGKNTLAYDKLAHVLPRHLRQRCHPMTPVINQKTSKRSFDGQVRKWRRMLHEWYENLPPEERVARTDAETERQVHGMGVNDDAAQSEREHEQEQERTSDVSTEPDVERKIEKSTRDRVDAQCVEDEILEALSDLDDIELDDMGNLVENPESAASSVTDARDAEVMNDSCSRDTDARAQSATRTIFDDFEEPLPKTAFVTSTTDANCAEVTKQVGEIGKKLVHYEQLSDNFRIPQAAVESEE